MTLARNSLVRTPRNPPLESGVSTGVAIPWRDSAVTVTLAEELASEDEKPLAEEAMELVEEVLAAEDVLAADEEVDVLLATDDELTPVAELFTLLELEDGGQAPKSSP